MLFMTIFTYEPAQREEVVARRLKGPLVPEGAKIHGEWAALGGLRVFRLVEVDDPKLILAASYAWTDLGKIEMIPVMEVQKVMEQLQAQQKG